MAELENTTVPELLVFEASPYETVGFVDTSPPTFAGITRASESGGIVTLAWNAATDDVTATDAIEYEVHVSTEPGDTWTTRAVVSAADVLPVNWQMIEGPIECSFDLENLAPGKTYCFRVRARDAAGNVDGNTEEASAIVTADETAPSISDISPVPGTPIRPTDTVSFNVTDNVDLRHVEIRVAQRDVVETVFNGTAFVGRYTGSARVAIAGGHRFTVLRSGGWASSPTFSVDAIDSSGNKA
jgi:predicted phage tail protein